MWLACAVGPNVFFNIRGGGRMLHCATTGSDVFATGFQYFRLRAQAQGGTLISAGRGNAYKIACSQPRSSTRIRFKVIHTVKSYRVDYT